MNEEVKNLIEDTVAMLDADEAPDVYDYLSELTCEDSEDLIPTMEIISRLLEMKSLPKVVWDLVLELYESEIRNGNDDAMNDLGALYYEGTGCEQSFEKAVYYYKMAAEHGNRKAQENLGYCYYYGRNMPVDYEKAFHYFALGAFDGQLISLYKIGDMYANGYYVKKNEKEAFLIYSRCIDTMTDDAAEVVAGPVFLRLGKAFLYGKGTEPDAESALVCYQKAEFFLYDMVKNGEVMYKKSLAAAIEGQAKAREQLLSNLPKSNWIYD